MDLELYDSLTFQELDVEFWGDNDALKPIKPAVEDVFACLPEYDTDLRTEINRLKKALPQPNSLVELLMEESHTPDPADMPSIFNQKKSETCNLQKVPSLTDISKPSRNIMASSAATELPLFTPGTNRKMSMALKTSFGLFESERKRGNIPLNPLAWSQTHVSQWLAWICREFNITNLNTIYFKKTGRELLEMGEETFLAIAPPFTGDVLWEHLIYLVKENNNAENDVLEQALLENGLLGHDVMLGAPVTDNRSSQSYDLLSSMDMEDAVFNTNESLLSQIDPPPYGSNGILNYNPMAMPLTAEQLQYRPLLRKSMSGGCMTVENDANDQTVPSLKSDQWDSQSTSWGSPSSDSSANADLPTIPGCNHNGPIQLWQFLLQLLMDKNSQHIICWTGDGWEFKVLDTEELARRWGQRKNKPKMTYEKLSRGIRYYYDKKLIKKTSGKRYTYQYVCDLSGMLNHTPESLFRACGVSPRYDLDDAYN